MENKEPNYTEDFLLEAHKSIVSNKSEILAGEICGCIVCLATFPPSQIPEWVTEPDGIGETAVCPKCEMDCVLSSKFPVTDEKFLQKMHNYFISDQQF